MLSKYEIREIAKELAKLLTAKEDQTPDKLLTTKEAATLLKMSVSTLYKREDIPYKKVGWVNGWSFCSQILNSI